jgi:hypothetical protein
MDTNKMSNELIGKYRSWEKETCQTGLDALADVRKSAPIPKVRRTILRRLMRRLDEERIFENTPYSEKSIIEKFPKARTTVEPWL